MKDKINNWFISPDGSNKDYITNFFSRVIEQLIHSRSNASVNELVTRGIQDFSFIAELNDSHSLEQILDKLSVIYENSMNASSVGYIGQMDSIPNIGSIIGDMVTASINNNMLANEMSPFLTWLEQNIIDLFSNWFGFDKNAGGVMTSGGTLSNIQALTAARNVKLNIKEGNLFGITKQPVFLLQNIVIRLLKNLQCCWG